VSITESDALTFSEEPVVESTPFTALIGPPTVPHVVDPGKTCVVSGNVCVVVVPM
jgi:hypothetical protein